MAKAKATATTKIKKKVWCPILAPSEMKNISLGETYVADQNEAIGRIIHANLKTVTGDMRDQNVYLKFRISGASGSNLATEIVGYYMIPSSVKKLTRRTANRLDDSFVVATKDGKHIRIKPVVVTAYKTVRSTCSAVRRHARQIFAREVSKIDYITLIERVITHQLQSEVRKQASKIFPVKIVEIKIIEFAKFGKPEPVIAAESQEQIKQDEKPKKRTRKNMAPQEEEEEAAAQLKEEANNVETETITAEKEQQPQKAQETQTETQDVAQTASQPSSDSETLGEEKV